MIAIVDPVTGLAGDMFLAALLDAGASLDVVREVVASTGLPRWHLCTEHVDAHGLAATRATVEVTDTAITRSAAELIELVGRARPAVVAERAVAAVRALAAVEGRLHGVDPAAVHLHELGGHDTVVDVVGVCAALADLGVDELYCGPLPMGTGTVRTAHGELPVPAPATAELLRGARVVGSELTGETVTPTAAALLTALGARYDAPPLMTATAVGYGAGTRVLPDRPNVARVRLGVTAPASPGDSKGPGEQTVVELVTNLDDVTGETIGFVLERALAVGALDAWVLTGVGKKSRPVHVLHALVAPDALGAVRDVILRETGSLGVRATMLTRQVQPRETVTVDVEGHPVRVKRGPHGAKAEHGDVAAAAVALDRPLREVAARAVDLSTRGER